MADIEIAKKSDLDTKADVNHNHDDRYALISHTHNEYATKEELNSKADVNHNHDDRYALSDHTHSYNELTDKPEIPRIDNLVTKEEFNALIEKVNNLESRLEALESQEDTEWYKINNSIFEQSGKYAYTFEYLYTQLENEDKSSDQ